ncbi:MAG: DMT family transporter [Bacteroidia bacterium]|nr:DMT family transporter [Bacteroidia bacterium]
MGILYLLLSISASCYIVLYFKYLERFGFPLLPVIAVNYLTCVICGAIQSPGFAGNILSAGSEIMTFGLSLGLLFIGIFFCIGYVTQKAGAGFVAILSKMCVIIPVLFSVFYLNEKINAWNITGIIFAVFSIFLIQYRTKGSGSAEPLSVLVMILSALVFLGSGMIDTSLKIFDVYYSHLLPESEFSILIFGSAAVTGFLILAYMYISGKIPLDYRPLIAGIGLGIPNYFSILFLLKALSYIQASVFFPLNNIGVVLAVCFLGILLFKEVYTRINYIGVAVAISAILLLAL